MQNDSGKAFSFDNQNVNDQEPSIMDIAPPPPPASVGNQVEDGLSPDDAMQMDLPPLPGEAGAAPVSEPSQGAEAAQTAEEQLGAPIFPEDSGTVFDIFDPQPTVVAPKKQKAEPAPPKQEPEKKAVSKPVRTEPRVKLPTEYRLPAKIYKKEYDKLNRHLPEARYEHEYDHQLFLAVGNDRPDVVRTLLETGRNIEMRNAEGDTPLLYAVRTKAKNTLRMLLGRGANPNATNDKGVTALHYAILANSPQMANALLEMGADPNMPDIAGATPLMLATSRDDAALTSGLIQRGAVVNLPSADGRSPLHVAAQANNANAVALLVQAGADINARNMNGYTPLMAAALAGASDSVNVLLNAGANVYATDSRGFTALDLARSRGKGKAANTIMAYMVQLDRGVARAVPMGGGRVLRR
jgi:ankyrin repeat protein